MLEAENGEQAIRVLKSESNMIHCGLILCDISMPKVNSLEGNRVFPRAGSRYPNRGRYHLPRHGNGCRPDRQRSQRLLGETGGENQTPGRG